MVDPIGGAVDCLMWICFRWGGKLWWIWQVDWKRRITEDQFSEACLLKQFMSLDWFIIDFFRHEWNILKDILKSVISL